MNQAHLRLVVARYWIGVELPADAEEAEAEAGHEKTVENQPIPNKESMAHSIHVWYIHLHLVDCLC